VQPRNRRRALAIAGLTMAACTPPALAANWLMLQGTEPPKATHSVFAFIQPTYIDDQSDALSGLTRGPGADFSVNNGRRLAVTSVAPDFDQASEAFIQRLKFGMRGNFTGAARNSLTAKMNYMVLLEAGKNLQLYDPFGDRARPVALDHASLTFNHIPGARVRAGLFKTPGPEELFQAVQTLDYVEFTDFIAREQLERFTTGAAQPAGSPKSPVLGVKTNTAYGFNAARDWGVQVFDSFRHGKWDLSYAVMAGRGEAISESDRNNDAVETYLYGSAEYILPGGKGPFRNGVKFYGWHQSGKRQFATDPANNEYDRVRYGVGFKALGNFFGMKHKQRLSGELMYGDGMIFIAPAGGVANGALDSGNLQIAAEKGNKSRGMTLDYGYFLDRHWEFDLRWARHDLLYETSPTVNPGNERVFHETTLGLNYHFNPKIRLTFDYTFKSADAPTAYAAGGNYAPVPGPVAANLTSNVKTLVDNVDDRVALRLTWIF